MFLSQCILGSPFDSKHRLGLAVLCRGENLLYKQWCGMLMGVISWRSAFSVNSWHYLCLLVYFSSLLLLKVYFWCQVQYLVCRPKWPSWIHLIGLGGGRSFCLAYRIVIATMQHMHLPWHAEVYSCAWSLSHLERLDTVLTSLLFWMGNAFSCVWMYVDCHLDTMPSILCCMSVWSHLGQQELPVVRAPMWHLMRTDRNIKN